MPELPEVEVSKQGISPHITQANVVDVVIRQYKLRKMIPANLSNTLNNQQLLTISRKAKYLLFHFTTGTLIIHLGMSGSLRIIDQDHNHLLNKHDHLDIIFDNNKILRYRDPRKFGLIDWVAGDIADYPLFSYLGLEPLEDSFNALYLYSITSKQTRNIKTLLMDHKFVVGIGNIYANEILFISKILPMRPANSITMAESKKLVSNTKKVLQSAISAGGSTLKDFVQSDGSSGYFQQQYFVYGRYNQPCKLCGSLIKKLFIAQRNSFYCDTCQQ